MAARYHDVTVPISPDLPVWPGDPKVRLERSRYASGENVVHTTRMRLLGAGVLIIEGLDLARVPPGDYELLCLPLLLEKGDGAPARVVLRELQSRSPQ